MPMSWSSGLPSKRIMGVFLRVGQLLSTVSFSLGASLGIWKGGLANWCMFIWCLCFAMSLITSIVELCGLQSHLPFSWDGFLYAISFHFGIICIVTSLIFGTSYIQVFSPGPAQKPAPSPPLPYPSLLLCFMPSKWPGSVSDLGDMVCFVPTFPGVLRRLENYLAWPSSLSSATLTCTGPAGPGGVFSCTPSSCILGVVNFLVNGCDCDNDQSCPSASPFYCGCRLCSPSSSYATAVILWPLYQFHEKLGGSPSGPVI